MPGSIRSMHLNTCFAISKPIVVACSMDASFGGSSTPSPWHTDAVGGRPPHHPNINASGTPGVSQTTLTLDDEPELRIDFNKLVDTGPLSARGASGYGGELGASWRDLLGAGG